MKNFYLLRRRDIFFLFLSLLFFSSQGRAEIDSFSLATKPLTPSDEKIITLDTLSVKEKKENKVFASPYSFSVINSSEWSGTNKSIADIISEQTGIQTRRYGGSGSFQTVSIRGVEGKEVIVFLDGIPLNSSMGGAVDLSAINPETIEEIEIYKSIIPAKFGGNSLGGVINLKTKKDNVDKIKNILNMRIGAYGYKGAYLNSTSKIKENLCLFSGVNYISSDNNWNYLDRNKTPYNLNDDKISKVENHKYRAFDIIVNPTFLLRQDKKIRSGFSYSFSTVGIPGTEGSVNKTARNEKEKAIITINFGDIFNLPSPTLSINGDVGYLWWRDNIFWTSLDEDMGSSHGTIINKPNSFSQSESKLSTFYGNTIVNLNLLEYINTQIVIGAKYSSIWTETYTSAIPHGDWPGSSTELISATDINIKIPLGKVAINSNGGISGKVIKSKSIGGFNEVLRMEFPPKDTIEMPWAFKGGIQLKYTDYCNIFFNAAKYSNIPTLRERYGTNGAVLPNPNLKEEKGNSFESGLRLRLDKISAEVVGFLVKNRDKIVMIFDGSMTKPANLGASCTKGIETSILFNPISFVKAEIRSTFQNPENFSLFNNYYKKKLPNEPILSLLGRVILTPLPNTELNYWVDYRSYFYRDFGNTQRIPDNPTLWGMDFHNFLLKMNLFKNFNLYFSIRNLSRITLRYEELVNSYESGYSWILYPVNEWCLTIESIF